MPTHGAPCGTSLAQDSSHDPGCSALEAGLGKELARPEPEVQA